MPRQNEILNRTGYYLESTIRGGDEYTLGESLGLAASDILSVFESPTRFEVLNLEPRVEIPSQKRAIIHARDENICAYCRTPWEILTIDHIIPRSAFDKRELQIADRSDNLISACWDCNESKSNFEHPTQKRLGVTRCCLSCANKYIDEPDQIKAERTIPAFCGQCSMTSHVPDLSWIL